VRTLPLRLIPVTGESLPGYVARYSHTFALQPRDVLRALGLEDPAGRTPAAGCFGVSLRPDQLARVAFATGIEPDQLEWMLLSRYADRAFPRSSLAGPIRLRREVLAREALIWRSRFCPRCLSEDGAWLLPWQLGWSVVCVRHRELLRDRCHRCGTVTQICPRAIWPRNDRGPISDSTCCPQTHKRELCGAPLTASSAIGASEELVSAQARIDALLQDGQQPTLAGEAIDPPVYLHDLRVLANILYHRPRLKGSRGPRRRSCAPVLDDPGVLAAVLPRLLALVDLPDQDALSDALRELIDQRYHETGETLKRWTLKRVSPRLREALQRAVNESAWASPSSRLGFSAANHRRPRDLDHALHARHVPQLFWASDYDRELDELLALADCAPSAGRRFCSVMLARLLTRLDWGAAVRYLDLPDQFIHGGYNTTFAKLRHTGVFDDLARRIKRIANDHAKHGLIDYKQRRAHLAAWSGIDAHTWRLIQPEPLPPSRRWDRPRRRARAAVWLWCQLTSGHEHAAPIALPHPGLRHHYAFVRTVIPALRERLLLFGDVLLATPPGALEAAPARFAVTLRRQGHLAPNRYLTTVSPLMRDRVLAHASAHTGVDIATITASPAGAASPAAVAHARLLTAVLLQDIALASPASIASILNGDAGRLGDNQRAYRTTLARTPQLAAELAQLTRAIEAWETPAPTPPSTPHHERMIGIATAIKGLANDLLAHNWGTDLAQRASMLACTEHTDLAWPDITAIHDRPTARRANNRASVTYHRRTDAAVSRRYIQLLDHAHALRRSAGYANAHLKPGLTPRTSIYRPPAATGN
jgi:hypothetical protein